MSEILSAKFFYIYQLTSNNKKEKKKIWFKYEKLIAFEQNDYSTAIIKRNLLQSVQSEREPTVT